MIANLICDRLFKGREVHNKIRLLAACNPYRYRKTFANNAGLQTPNGQYEEQSRLVYQVHPLPQKLLDFIWDYGVLEENDERAYIDIMAKGLRRHLFDGTVTEDSQENVRLFSETLFKSQRFIRGIEDAYSVSLRDVRRTIAFANFFDRELNSQARSVSVNRRSPERRRRFQKDIFRNVRAIVLALVLCYQGRLSNQEDRARYRKDMCDILVHYGIPIGNEGFMRIVRDEQEEIISRMKLPAFTARNDALLENIFAMTACILTRTPLFLIGAPGASKSLAVKIVKENLRGHDSVDPYFQTHPQVYIVPHQGSSSSTSEGILKVFAKAERYETRHNPNNNKFPSRAVVLLDEGADYYYH